MLINKKEVTGITSKMKLLKSIFYNKIYIIILLFLFKALISFLKKRQMIIAIHNPIEVAKMIYPISVFKGEFKIGVLLGEKILNHIF